jgi:hypothetical protein
MLAQDTGFDVYGWATKSDVHKPAALAFFERLV